MGESTDVLIVGAGPVGLMLAGQLARDGVDATLIEHHPGRLFFCKALGVTARTIEIFEELGIASQAIDAGVWGRGLTVFENGERVAEMELPTEGLPYGALLLPQYDTERLLEAALRASCRRPCRATGSTCHRPERHAKTAWREPRHPYPRKAVREPAACPVSARWRRAAQKTAPFGP